MGGRSKDLEMESGRPQDNIYANMNDVCLQKRRSVPETKAIPPTKTKHSRVLLILVIVLIFMFLILTIFTVLLFMHYKKVTEEVSHLKDNGARSCKELRDGGVVLSNWYTIYPDGTRPLKVLCDMHTDGGGWIKSMQSKKGPIRCEIKHTPNMAQSQVFQRRADGSVDFYRGWEDYKRGFGSQLSEFWLGNDNIHQLTATGSYQLRVDLEDFDKNRTYATYSGFKLEDEGNLYRLRFSNFTGGTAGDSLNVHKNMSFTTKDRDNDTGDKANCAVLWSGAWWYKSCHNSNLNGLYLGGQQAQSGSGVNWFTFRTNYYSHKVSEMKFRPE